MRYGVILAGGPGTRLWPLSRNHRPKQILKLVENTSLLRLAYERLAGFIAPESIIVVAGEDHLPLIAAELPEVSPANLIGEPVGRDTANAIGLAAAIIARGDPDGVMGVFTADHLIRPLERFHTSLKAAFNAAEHHRDALVTFGIRPTSPQTSYGYIERGERIDQSLHRVARFTEKPELPVAERYVADGRHYWNSGMFVWRVDTILDHLRRYLPDAYSHLTAIARDWETVSRYEKLRALYPELQKISIDFAVLEHAERVLMVEMNCDWVDVGSWPALETVLSADEAGNVQAAPNVVHIDSSDNIVVSEEGHLIATVGVKDLVIVHATDATLICHKKDAQRIKQLVDELKAAYGDRYL